MAASLDFDAHIHWLDIVVKRLLCNNKENMRPLLCLSFINPKQTVYHEYKIISDNLSIDDLSTGFPYAILVNSIKPIEPSISEPNKLFEIVLLTLKSLGYNPSNTCDIQNLTTRSISDHVELCKIIEWAIVDRCLSIQMLCDDIKRLPRSFYILDHQPNLLEDAVSLWLSKFPMSHTLPMIKDFKTDIFQGQHIAFSLSRVYPKRILKDLINVGSELTDSMITQNWEYAKPVMDELDVFVPPFRQFLSPHILLLFFADIFYATRSGAKKFVRLDPPPLIITPKPTIKNETETDKKQEDTIEMKVLRQQKRFHQQHQMSKQSTESTNNTAPPNGSSPHRHRHRKSSSSKSKSDETKANPKDTESQSKETKSDGKEKQLQSNNQNQNSKKKDDAGKDKNQKVSDQQKPHSDRHKKSQNQNENEHSRHRHRKRKDPNKKNDEEDKNEKDLSNGDPTDESYDQSKNSNSKQITLPKSENEILQSPTSKSKESKHTPKSSRATNSEGDTDNNESNNGFSDNYVAPFSKSSSNLNNSKQIQSNISNSQVPKNQNDNPQEQHAYSGNNSNPNNSFSNTAPEMNNLNNLAADIPFQESSTLPLAPSVFPQNPVQINSNNPNSNTHPNQSMKHEEKVEFSTDDDDQENKFDGAFMITPFSKNGKRSKSAKQRKSKTKKSSKKRSRSSSRKYKQSSSDYDDSSTSSDSSSSSSSSSDSSDKKSKHKSKKHQKKDKNKTAKTLPETLAQFQEELGKFDLEAQIFTLEAKRHMLEAFTNQIKKGDQEHEAELNTDDTQNNTTKNDSRNIEKKEENPDMAALSICIDNNSTVQNGFTEDDIAKIKETLIKLANLPPNERTLENMRDILNSLFNGQNVTIDHVDDVYNKALSLFQQISNNPESIPQLMIDISKSLFGVHNEEEPIETIEEIIEEELLLVDDSTTTSTNNDNKDDNCLINQTIVLPNDNDEIEEEEDNDSDPKSKAAKGNIDQAQNKNGNLSNQTEAQPLQMMMTQEVETEAEPTVQSNMETQTDEFEENADQESSTPISLRLFEPVLLFEKASINPHQARVGDDTEAADLESLKCDITIRHIPFRRFTSFNRKTPTLRNTQLRPNLAIISTIIRFNAMPSPQQDLEKKKLLEYLRTYKDCRLIVLLTTMGQKIKAIYKMDSVDSDISKVWGNGPHVISQNDVGVYFKYITGTKKFEQIPTKHLTQTTDALSLKRKIEPRNW